MTLESGLEVPTERIADLCRHHCGYHHRDRRGYHRRAVRCHDHLPAALWEQQLPVLREQSVRLLRESDFLFYLLPFYNPSITQFDFALTQLRYFN